MPPTRTRQLSIPFSRSNSTIRGHSVLCAPLNIETPTASTHARSYCARRSASAEVIGVRVRGSALIRASMLAAARGELGVAELDIEDAGIGIQVAARTTLEVGARYSQTSRLSFAGQNFGTATSYQPTLRALSGTIGVRHVF